MVINSLLLILTDTLPVFMLMAFLANMNFLTLKRMAIALVMIVSVTLFVLLFANNIELWWDGFGIDVLRASLNLMCLPALLLLLTVRGSRVLQPSKAQATKITIWVVLALCSVAIPNSINYIVYFSGLWQSQTISSSFFVGLAMGLGISASVAVLLYLMLNSLKRTVIPVLLLSGYIAGQIAGVASMLEQINWLQDPVRLWNSTSLLSEHNEYGQLLRVLMGYEATPTQYYLIFYLLSLSVLGVSSWYSKQQNDSQVSGVSS